MYLGWFLSPFANMLESALERRTLPQIALFTGAAVLWKPWASVKVMKGLGLLSVSEEREHKYGAAYASSEKMTLELTSPTLGGATKAAVPSVVE